MPCLCRHRGEAVLQVQPFATWILEAGERSARHPGSFTLGKIPVTVVRELCGSRGQSGGALRISPHRDQIPGPANPQRVVLPTTLSHYTLLNEKIFGRVLGSMFMALRFMSDVARTGDRGRLAINLREIHPTFMCVRIPLCYYLSTILKPAYIT